MPFGQILQKSGIRRPAGCKGVCFDKGDGGIVLSSLKNEWLKRYVSTTRAKAKQQVIRYIEGFYNRR